MKSYAIYKLRIAVLRPASQHGLLHCGGRKVSRKAPAVDDLISRGLL